MIVARERKEAVEMSTPVRKGLKARPTAPHRDRSKYQRRTNVNIPAEEDIEFAECPDCGAGLLAQKDGSTKCENLACDYKESV